MANSVDTDQTAPLGAVWSGSALLAQEYLSQYFTFLPYISHNSLPYLPCIAWSEALDTNKLDMLSFMVICGHSGGLYSFY